MKRIEELKKNLIFIDSMADAMSEQQDESTEEIRKELRAEGIDLDMSVKNLLEFTSKCSMDAKREELERAAEIRKATEAETIQLRGKFNSWSKDEIIERIRSLTVIPEQQVSLAYRELDGKSQEDLASILEDLEAVMEMGDRNKKTQ